MVRSGYLLIATLTAVLAACGGKESSDKQVERVHAQTEGAPAASAPAAAPTMDVTGAPAAEFAPATEPGPATEPAIATELAPVASLDDDADAKQGVAGALTDGSPVRVESSYLESGWLEGTIGPSPGGCRVVFLSQPSESGYTSVALMNLERIERKDGESWQEIPVEPLLETEPSHCLETAAD